MRKVLITSDSHQYTEVFQRIIELHRDADIKIDCGDSCLSIDDKRLQDFLNVKGNHDFADFPLTIVSPPFFIAHGHRFNIYESEDIMIQEARKNNCSIVLHGHTHIPNYQIKDGISIINPGSIMYNRGNLGYGTYAIGYLNAINELKDLKFYHHQTHVDVSQEVLKDGKRILKEIRDKLNSNH